MATVQPFDFSVDTLRAVLWQYDGAERLQALLRAKAAWLDASHTRFWSDWQRDVFDLRTANDFGCSVWAIILGVPLALAEPGSGARPVFGFADFGLPFDQGNFGRDADGISQLSLDQKRLILRLRFYQLTSDGSVSWANRALQDVFGVGYVLDRLDMTIAYVFPQQLPAQVRDVLERFDLLPRPAGVLAEILIDPGSRFGFAPYYSNFDNGTFGG